MHRGFLLFDSFRIKFACTPFCAVSDSVRWTDPRHSKTVLSFSFRILKVLIREEMESWQPRLWSFVLFGWNMHGQIPSGKLTWPWKITIFNGKIHCKWAIFNSYFDITRGYIGYIEYPTENGLLLHFATLRGAKVSGCPWCERRGAKVEAPGDDGKKTVGVWRWELWILGTFWKSMWFDEMRFIEIQLMFDRSKRANTSSYSRMNYFVSLISLRYCVSVSLSPMEWQIRLDPKVWSPNWTGIEAVLQQMSGLLGAPAFYYTHMIIPAVRVSI